MNEKIDLPSTNPIRRRRYQVEQKRRLLEEAAHPGERITSVRRRYGISARMMFTCRRAMKEAGDEGLRGSDKVNPESEVKKLTARIVELERALGRKTVDAEILEAAGELAIEKKTYLAQSLAHEARWPMGRIASALKVSRSHFSHTQNHVPRPRGAYNKDGDAELVGRIRALVDERPSDGYRRVHAMLKRQPGYPPVNHKRVHRVMKQARLLPSRGHRHPTRPHNGHVITLKCNLRWCTDILEVRCRDGRKLHAALVLDWCDREAIAWVAKPQHLNAQHICDLMVRVVEARFNDTSVPHPIE